MAVVIDVGSSNKYKGIFINHSTRAADSVYKCVTHQPKRLAMKHYSSLVTMEIAHAIVQQSACSPMRGRLHSSFFHVQSATHLGIVCSDCYRLHWLQ